MIRVVVIGGGYAGTLAANHLRLRSDIDIALVNPRPMFVERLRLHQFVARTGIARRFAAEPWNSVFHSAGGLRIPARWQRNARPRPVVTGEQMACLTV
jgi:NADH dehydrogenase FAD-containing subunit